MALNRTTRLLLLILLLCTSCKGRQPKNEEKIIPTEEVSEIGHVNDELYLGDTLYLLNDSFLSDYEGYENLFSDLSLVLIQSIPHCSGAQDKKYCPVWTLYDSTLYLSDICFYVTSDEIDERYPQNKHYDTIEQFTGYKFEKQAGLFPSAIPKSLLGAMPAKWVTGVFYARKAMSGAEDNPSWDGRKTHRLEFKSGRLVSGDI